MLRRTLLNALPPPPTFPRHASRVLNSVYRQNRAPCRTYAFSRYGARTPGSGRRREEPPEKKERRNNPEAKQEEDDLGAFFKQWTSWGSQPTEDKPSAEESPLWQASQRRPASDPEEGLRRLLMDNNVLVVERQIEMLNIFIGFEQTNKYAITNEHGITVGYIAEEPRGAWSTVARQVFRTRRPFRAVVMDDQGTPVLWLRRPFAWINSRMYAQRLKDYHTYTPEGEPVLDTFAEVKQIWNPFRRQYELFLKKRALRVLSLASEEQPEPELEGEFFNQFAAIDEWFLAWHFALRDANGDTLASVDRAFRGFGRELFTDTSQYAIRFGSVLEVERPDGTMEYRRTADSRNLSLEERALVLATAVNIDVDYFSRHSGGGGIGLPLFFFLGE